MVLLNGVSGMSVRLISGLRIGLLFFLLLSVLSASEVITYEGSPSSSSDLVRDSTVNTFNTTASVHVFTPNASTAVIEAEEVEVTAITYTPEDSLKDIRPIVMFSGAFLAAALLIILRSRRKVRLE